MFIFHREPTYRSSGVLGVFKLNETKSSVFFSFIVQRYRNIDDIAKWQERALYHFLVDFFGETADVNDPFIDGIIIARGHD